MEAMARRLADASATMKVVATIGLVLVVQGFFSATFGTLARTFPAWLPQHTVDIGGVFVGEDQMIITGIALAATVALFLFFRLNPARPGHARRGRQPGAARPGRHQPGDGAAVGLDHRLQLRRRWPACCWRRP